MAEPTKEIYTYCPKCASKMVYKAIDGDRVQACPKCAFIFWNNPKPVVSIVVSDGGKVLMLRRARQPLKGYWCLPGGFIKFEEGAQEAIKRETKEEIGISPKVGRVFGVYRIDNDPRGIHIDIIFEGSVKGKIKISEEHDDWRYFDFNNLPDKIAYKHLDAISDWKKGLF